MASVALGQPVSPLTEAAGAAGLTAHCVLCIHIPLNLLEKFAHV